MACPAVPFGQRASSRCPSGANRCLLMQRSAALDSQRYSLRRGDATILVIRRRIAPFRLASEHRSIASAAFDSQLPCPARRFPNDATFLLEFPALSTI